MKFTEGFWVRSERANASYASQGFYAKKTELEALREEFFQRGEREMACRLWHRSVRY